jgi:hypothetical protein
VLLFPFLAVEKPLEQGSIPLKFPANTRRVLTLIEERRNAVCTSICDFCSEPSVAWRYPARNFVAYAVAGVVGQSIGDWAACSVCHRLIETGNHDELLERSLRTLFRKNPDMRWAEAEIREQIAGFHRMFFAHRIGAALLAVA